jgi:hypothetical protein
MTTWNEHPRRAEARGRPFVLKPYAVDVPLMWKRVVAWAMIPLLSVACMIYGFFYALTTPYLIPAFAAPVLVLAAFTIWALPDLTRAPTRSMQFLFFAFLYLLLLWPGYLAIVLPGLPWITPIRLIGFPLTLLLLVCVSISKEFRTTTAETIKAIPYLWQMTLAFCVIGLLSIGWSKGPMTSLNKFFDSQVNWTVIFFASCYIFRKKGTVEHWAAVLWVVSVVLCLIGLVEAKEQHVPWLGHIPSFIKADDEYVQHVLNGARRLGSEKYRVQGTRTTSLGMAEFWALTTPFVMYYIAGSYRLWVKIAAGASLPLIVYCIYLTDARLGMVGFLISLLLFVLTWGIKRWRQQPGDLLGPSVVLAYPAIFLIFMAATFFVGRLKRMVWGGSNNTYSDHARIDQLNMGLPKLAHRPWGYGVGQGGDELGYRNLGGALTIDTYWLLVALDYGIIGFLLYYATLLVVIGQSALHGLMEKPKERERAFLIPVAISLTAFFVIKSIYSGIENHSIVYMMMGMAAALIYRIKSDPAEDETKADAAQRPVVRGRLAPALRSLG